MSLRHSLLSCAFVLFSLSASTMTLLAEPVPARSSDAAAVASESSRVALARMQGYADTLIDQCEGAGAGEVEWICSQSVRQLDYLALNLREVCSGDQGADCLELDQELSRIRGFVAYRRGLQTN